MRKHCEKYSKVNTYLDKIYMIYCGDDGLSQYGILRQPIMQPPLIVEVPCRWLV